MSAIETITSKKKLLGGDMVSWIWRQSRVVQQRRDGFWGWDRDTSILWSMAEKGTLSVREEVDYFNETSGESCSSGRDALQLA